MRAVVPITGTAVAGTVEVPILTTIYADTPAAPYDVGEPQRELFDGPWDTGTMSELYTEMSRGKFKVTGQVHDWVHLPEGEDSMPGRPAATASATTCSLASS